MAKVLVIWEEIPEETKFYLLDLEGTELTKTLKAHGELINSTNAQKNAEFLSEFLQGKTPLGTTSKLGKAFEVKQEGIEYIVWTGFLL